MKSDYSTTSTEAIAHALNAKSTGSGKWMACCPSHNDKTPSLSTTDKGGKTVIRPKQYDDWTVTPNLWGALIGRPSAMKSSAMAEGLRPLKRLAVEARTQFKKESGEKLKIEAARSAAVTAFNNAGDPPTERRYIVNDSTIEKLGELLNENPNGLQLERDELTGWLRGLDREDRTNDRSFYLECFNGGLLNSFYADPKAWQAAKKRVAA